MRNALLFFTALICLNTFAADKDRPFKPGPGHFRGNEHSNILTVLQTGQPVYGGNACPQGTMRVAFAPDFLSFSMLFDQFVAQVSNTGAKRDVMACDVLLPVTIPAGQQMEITRVDFRGFVGLPDKSRAELHSVFNFRGPGGDRDKINLSYQFQGPVMDNYLISTDAMNSNNGQTDVSEVSPCGGNVVLRVATQLHLVSQVKGQDASVTLDSVDGSSHAIYYVNWKACTAGNSPREKRQ
jgi:hypothetical protein